MLPWSKVMSTKALPDKAILNFVFMKYSTWKILHLHAFDETRRVYQHFDWSLTKILVTISFWTVVLTSLCAATARAAFLGCDNLFQCCLLMIATMLHQCWRVWPKPSFYRADRGSIIYPISYLDVTSTMMLSLICWQNLCAKRCLSCQILCVKRCLHC
jgi:hypothetical protein